MNNKVDKYLNDQDVIGVANAAAKSFFGVLSKDEIQNCILNAIWKASSKFDKRHNVKFTSYIHNGVVLECLNQRKFNRNKQSKKLTSINIPDPSNYFDGFEMRDLIDSVCEDPSIIYDRYYKNMTVSEIAKERNVCGETIRIRLRKNLEKMRLSLDKSV